MNESNPYAAPRPSTNDDPIEVEKKGPPAWPSLLISVAIFIFDFVQLVAVVILFDLNETEPDWETAYAIFTMLVLPLIGIGFFFRGLVRLFRR